MSLTAIRLPTNKSISIIDNDNRTLSQDEKGLIQRFILLNANSQPYNLSDKKVQFNEQKTGGKVVIDDTNMNYIDRAKGIVDYTLHPQVYTASGSCWLAIINNDGAVVDTTKRFQYKVEQSATISVTNDNYISTMEAQINNLKANVQRVDDALDSKLREYQNEVSSKEADANNRINSVTQSAQNSINQTKSALDALATHVNQISTQYTNLQNDWNAQKQKIQTDADNQIAAIKKDADDQYDSIQNKSDDAINKITQARDSAISQVNAQRDAAIKAANDSFNQRLTTMQTDYESWKAGVTVDLNKQIADLNSKISTDRTDIANAHQEVDQIKSTLAECEKQFDKIDFTHYVTNDQFENMKVTKASGLKVMGLGGEYVMAVDQSDQNINGLPNGVQGLADMGILSGALQVLADAILDKNHYTKTEVDKMKQDTINQLQGIIQSKTDDLTGKLNEANSRIQNLEQIAVPVHVKSVNDVTKQKAAIVIVDD